MRFSSSLIPLSFYCPVMERSEYLLELNIELAKDLISSPVMFGGCDFRGDRLIDRDH